MGNFLQDWGNAAVNTWKNINVGPYLQQLINNNNGGGSGGGASTPNPQDQYMNPANQRAYREADISRGMQRGKDLFVNDPNMMDVRRRLTSNLEGLNSRDMQLRREQMAGDAGRTERGYLRQLMSTQGRAGVVGPRAAAQQMMMQGDFSRNRLESQNKLMLEDYAAKQNALKAYQDQLMKEKSGILATGLGEGQLGTNERTGYLNYLTGKEAAAAANKEPKKGFLGNLFDDLGF